MYRTSYRKAKKTTQKPLTSHETEEFNEKIEKKNVFTNNFSFIILYLRHVNVKLISAGRIFFSYKNNNIEKEKYINSYRKIINGQIQITCVAAIAPKWHWVRFSRDTSNSASYKSYERPQSLVDERADDVVELQ